MKKQICSFFFSPLEIRAIYHRECEPLICPSVHDLRGPWPNTAPVCASNGYTYGHVHQARCLSGHIPGTRRIQFEADIERCLQMLPSLRVTCARQLSWQIVIRLADA